MSAGNQRQPTGGERRRAAKLYLAGAKLYEQGKFEEALKNAEVVIIGNKSAPFINALAANGANMVQSFAETHPSEPNYLALFAGNTLGVTKDSCPVDGATNTSHAR